MTRTLLQGLRSIVTARGTQAVTDDSSVVTIADGAILVEDGRIAKIGTRDQLQQNLPPNTEVVDMGQKVAIPCFVDPHTHLVWGGDRSSEFNQRLHGAGYTDIAAAGGGIKATVRHTRAASVEQLQAKATKTLNTMMLHGTGSIEAKSGYGLDLATEIKQLDVMDQLEAHHRMEIHQTFMGAHEVPPEFQGDPAGYIRHLNQNLLPMVRERGTVPYVDIFCEKGVFELENTKTHMEAALKQGFRLRMHADELFSLGGAGLAADLGAVSADHLIHAKPEDMAKMAKAGTMATLLPGTSFFLRTHYADAAAFKKSGCALALSTDFNPGSSHTVSQALMMALGCMKLGMTFEESFIGVTLNAAAAIESADRLGTLEPGKQADIAFLDVPDAFHLVYFWGINHVSDLMKKGRFAVRDRKLCA